MTPEELMELGDALATIYERLAVKSRTEAVEEQQARQMARCRALLRACVALLEEDE